jgi:Cof subfamily protein (haloacid dehalogenase superfamily)
MAKYRLLAIDIDGTLVDARGEVRAVTREALLAVQAAGIRVVLVTGRRYSRTLPLVDALRLDPTTPLVTASGALIKRPADHQTLHRAEFSRDTLARLLAELSAAGYDAVLYADTFAQGFDYYCRRLDAPQPELAEYFQLNTGSERLHAELMHQPPDGVFAGFAMGSRSQMLELEARLRGQLDGRLDLHVLRSPRYLGFMCEVAPAGWDKWTGVSRLTADWGIDPEEVCAVGDDVNDVPMLRGAGLGVAMANATPPALAAADRVAPPLDEDGLATVCRWLLA